MTAWRAGWLPTVHAASLVRRASMVALALPLLYVVQVFSSGLAGAAAMQVLLASGRIYSPNLLWDLALVATLASAAGVYAAVPASRFMLRVFPLHSDGRRRWLLVLAMALLAAGSVALICWRMFHPIDRSDAAPGPQARLTGLVVVLAQAGVLIWLLCRRDAGVTGSRVLYLRRFRSASDRVVYGQLLAALPVGSTLTALVPLSGGARDLDPFTIGLAGMRWRDPLASIPRTYDSDDATWQDHVRRMLLAADCVVIDGSAPSAAMQVEYGLTEALGLGAKTIVLAAEDTPAPPQFTGATLLRYAIGRWPSPLRLLSLASLAILYGWAAFDWPHEYPPLGLLCFLPMLPAALQRPVARRSLRALRAEISRRLPARPRLQVAARRLACAGLLLLPTCAVLLTAFGARWLCPLVPSSDAAGLRALTRPMSLQAVRVGERSLDIPVVAGFIDPKDAITSVRRQLIDDAATHGHPLLTLVPIGWVVHSLFDDHVPRDAGMTLGISRDLERDLLDEAAFRAMRLDFSAQLAGAEANGMSGFEVVDEGPRFVTLSFQAAVPQRMAGQPASKTCTATLILLTGKPLTLEACRYRRSAEDAKWIRRLTALWVAQALASNPALPPLDRTGYGFRVSVELGAQLGLEAGIQRQASVTVTEVMPGSAAAQAGLRPGDQVIDVDGVAVSPNPGRLADTLKALPRGGSTRLKLLREGTEMDIVLVRPIGAPATP